MSRAVAAPETGGSEVSGPAATTLLGLLKGNLIPHGPSPRLPRPGNDELEDAAPGGKGK